MRRLWVPVVVFAGAGHVVPARATVVYQRPATNEIVAARDDGSAAHVVARGQFPVVSPDGRRIVFLATKHSTTGPIRIVGARRGRPRTVLRGGVAARGRAGYWSADGRRLALGRAPRGGMVIVSLRSDRSRLVRFSGDFGGASFSPDGSRLLIERLAADIKQDDVLALRVRGGSMHPAGVGPLPVWGRGGIARLQTDATTYDQGTYAAIRVARTPASGGREILRTGPSLAGPVGWSADGTRLLVADEPSSRRVQAIVVDVQSGARHTLATTFTSTSIDSLGLAALSRDGRAVLGEAGGDVVTEDLDGDVAVLAHGAVTPSWTR